MLRGDHQSFGEALLAAGEQFGDRIAFIEGDQRLSFAQWARSADGFAAYLKEKEIGPGDIVAVLLPSSIDYAICTAGIHLAGAIATGINLRLGPREIGAILNRTRPRLVILEGQGALPDLDYVPQILRRANLAACWSRAGLGARRPVVTLDSPACIVWTSGTTGLPKGALFDHANLKAAIGTAGAMAGPYDCCLIPLPFAHAGYMTKQWQQVAFAITYVLMPPVWSAREMLRLMLEEQVTVGFGVPTQWGKFLELPELATADLSRLRLCATSTAPAPPELVERLIAVMGCPLITRYAMTESPSISGTSIGDTPEVLHRTLGRPQEGVSLMIADDRGQAVAAGTVGRIRLKGPTVMRGYWNDPERTAEVMTPDGWLLSSDLGYLDESGNLVLVGRVSDMYIRGGYNVYPLEVENVLAEHPGVGRAAVVGIPAPIIGEIGVAFIEASDKNAPPSAEALQAWCRARLADYKTPDTFRFVTELPLTSMLKVDKAALRATAMAATATGT